MLEVRLLGRFEIRQDGELLGVPTRPAQSLLAYLILSAGTVHLRERVAGLFWPETSESSARDNLRHALWRIRKAIGQEYLLTDRGSVSFDDTSDYWLDVSILETALVRE